MLTRFGYLYKKEESPLQTKNKKVFEAYGATDTGLVRDTNEDSFIVDENLGLFIVADGLGGHNGGEIASRLAVEAIAAYFKEVSEAKVKADLKVCIGSAIQKAHEAIIKASTENPLLGNMGTVLVMGLIDPDGNLYIANVGDSRGYLYRNKKLHLLTKDHSLVASLVKEGKIKAEEARGYPLRNIVTQIVGIEPVDDYYQREAILKENDIIILCSDGLWDMLPDKNIEAWASREDDPRRLCLSLIDAAKASGGEDNITVIAIKVNGSR